MSTVRLPGNGETEAFVVLQLDRPERTEDLVVMTGARRASVPGARRAMVTGARAAADPGVVTSARRAAIPDVITGARRAAPDPEVAGAVFGDESGHRAKTLQWVGRGLCLLGVLLGAALVLTLRVHVSVPGLEKGLFGSNAGFSHASKVPSDTSSELQGIVHDHDSNRVEATGQGAQRSEPTPTTASTSNSRAVAAIQSGQAMAPTTPSTQPSTTAPGVRASAGSATPPAVGKTKPRNPRAADPTPRGHGRHSSALLAE